MLSATAATIIPAPIAVSIAGQLWFVQTSKHTVVKSKPHTPLALGFAPDGTKLWAVLNGELVIALPVV